jgi:hypothetical protein
MGNNVIIKRVGKRINKIIGQILGRKSGNDNIFAKLIIPRPDGKKTRH